MAVRQTRYCDLTGEPEADLVVLAVDGEAWEVDLGEVGRKQLREALDPFLTVGRRIGPVGAVEVPPVGAAEPGDPGPMADPVEPESAATSTAPGARPPWQRTTTPSKQAGAGLTGKERKACRAWAQRNPKKADADVGQYGQIPAGVVDRWILAGRPGL